MTVSTDTVGVPPADGGPEPDLPSRPRPLDDLPAALPSLWHTLRLGYDAEPRLLAVSFLMTAITALPDALIALWLALLTDGAVSGRFDRVGWAAAGLAVSAVLMWLLRILLERLERRFRDRVGIAVETRVAELQARIGSIEHHERPEVLDRLAVLRDQVFALDHLFQSLFAMSGWMVRLAVTLALLATVHPALLLLGLFGLPMLATATWRPGVERRVEEQVAEHDRLARHLFLLGVTAAPSKEVRLQRLEGSLAARRADSWRRWYEPTSRTYYSSAAWATAAWAVFGLAYVAAIVFVATGAAASAGALVLVLAAGNRLSSYIASAVGELGFLRGIWLDASRKLLWLERLAQSADQRADAAVPARLERGISFERVSFTYPGSTHPAVHDLSLELPAGSVVALVGENGAGKTTLVKLLARMYEPSAGRILVDGMELDRFPLGKWRERLAGAFQDFFRFELRAQTSIGLGDEPRKEDEGVVTAAADRAGASDVIEHLGGLDTQLGPSWDGGVEVSHGQWQKLALARGFMRDDPLLLVLDEPTSALDAETESALFERYAESARTYAGNGRITLLVSHRFSTVRMADLIVVLGDASVLEVGRHEDLIAAGGVYAELYEMQAGSYR